MLFLIQKEFKQILRNKFLPRIIIFFPIMILLIMPWAMSMEVKDIKLALLDNDKSSLSSKLAQKLKASSYFKLSLNASNMQEANECINLGKCDLIIEIPPHFEQDLQKNHKAALALYANSIDASKSSLGSSYALNIISDFQGELLGVKESEVVASIYRFNARLEYKSYMIPALMVMVLTLICGFLPAFNIVSEKEKGTSDQINVSPISKFRYILAKLVPYWCIGFVVLSLCFLLAFLLYGLSPRGSFLLIYLFALVYVLVVTGLGLVISNISASLQQAMFVAYFFLIILILMSGLFTSIKSMPAWALLIADANPLRYFIEALRLIYLKGSGFEELYTNFFVLFAFALVFNTLAILGYKKQS